MVEGFFCVLGALQAGLSGSDGSRVVVGPDQRARFRKYR